jgi:hypothetical protein
MDESGAKAARRLLRIISDHWRLTCMDRGAEVETLDLVDVVYHPGKPDPALNVVTPRRSTAWVAASYIQPGLTRLRELGRTPRVQFIAGLYPPQFAVVLRDLGLGMEHETPLMALEPHSDNLPDAALPDGGRIAPVTDSETRRLWQYVWRSAYYDVNLLGIDDTASSVDALSRNLKRRLEAVVARLEGQQPAAPQPQPIICDFLYWHYQQPMGAARLIIRPDLGSAHLETLALHEAALRDLLASMDKDVFNPMAAHQDGPPLSAADEDALRVDMLSALIAAALRSAHQQGIKLVFVPAEDDPERRACRRVGFIDLSSFVRYAPVSRREEERHVAEAVHSPHR